MKTFEWLAIFFVSQLAIGAITGATVLAIASGLGAISYVLMRYFGEKLIAAING